VFGCETTHEQKQAGATFCRLAGIFCSFGPAGAIKVMSE
jgi:hypothetical protein